MKKKNYSSNNNNCGVPDGNGNATNAAQNVVKAFSRVFPKTKLNLEKRLCR